MVYLVLGVVFGFEHRRVALDTVDVVGFFPLALGFHELPYVVFEGVVVYIVGFHADYRLDARLVCGLVKVDCPAHVPVVGDGYGGHSELLHPVYEDGDFGASVEYGIVCVHVQVYEV